MLPTFLLAVVALLNPAFEDIKGGKAVGWTVNGDAIRAERGVGHNGSGGIVWESSEPAKEQFTCLQKVDVEREKAYKFSCLVKMENFKAGQNGYGAAICVEWYDAKGKWMAGGYSEKRFVDRNRDWFQIDGVTQVIPAGAISGTAP